MIDVCVLGLRVRVLELRTNNVVLLGGDIGEYLKEVRQGGDKNGGSWSDGDDGQQVDNKRGQEDGGTDRGVREDGDGEMDGGVAIWAQIVPGVVGTIEEVLNDLVGGGNVDLINIINLRPRGNREGRGGNGSGSSGSDKRR